MIHNPPNRFFKRGEGGLTRSGHFTGGIEHNVCCRHAPSAADLAVRACHYAITHLRDCRFTRRRHESGAGVTTATLRSKGLGPHANLNGGEGRGGRERACGGCSRGQPGPHSLGLYDLPFQDQRLPHEHRVVLHLGPRHQDGVVPARHSGGGSGARETGGGGGGGLPSAAPALFCGTFSRAVGWSRAPEQSPFSGPDESGPFCFHGYPPALQAALAPRGRLLVSRVQDVCPAAPGLPPGASVPWPPPHPLRRGSMCLSRRVTQ